jgi:pimeloyl-ACP methyl ester carboxylesterase
VVLQRAGFNLLLFDFRGHGASGGTGSTLGSEEAYDVQGAIDFLRTRRDLPADRIGVWGVGMGAYAAILAAPERKQVVALALDSAYPDIQTFLDQVLFRGVPQAASSVTRYASAFYGPYFRWKIYKGSAARVVPRLVDRNFLFIVSAARPGSVEAGRRFYESLPDGGQADRNLLELESTGFSGSYAADRRKNEEAITAFFNTYLPPRPQKPPEPIRLQVR